MLEIHHCSLAMIVYSEIPQDTLVLGNPIDIHQNTDTFSTLNILCITLNSLVPRSSRHPVFDHLLCAKKQVIKSWMVERPATMLQCTIFI